MVVRTLISASAVLIAAAAAQAQESEAPTTVVSFQAHELGAPDNRSALHDRLEREIRAICNRRGQRTLAAFTREKQCERNARENVEMQLGYPIAELAPRSGDRVFAEAIDNQ